MVQPPPQIKISIHRYAEHLEGQFGYKWKRKELSTCERHTDSWKELNDWAMNNWNPHFSLATDMMVDLDKPLSLNFKSLHLKYDENIGLPLKIIVRIIEIMYIWSPLTILSYYIIAILHSSHAVSIYGLLLFLCRFATKHRIHHPEKNLSSRFSKRFIIRAL